MLSQLQCQTGVGSSGIQLRAISQRHLVRWGMVRRVHVLP